MTLARRALRYSSLLPIARLAETHATIIGVGAIGRQVALALATQGVGYLTLYDPDVVSEENLGVQGYRPDQLDEWKVEATQRDILAISPECKVAVVKDAFELGSRFTRVVFCCVDSIDTRGRIFEIVHDKVDLFLDARMAAEVYHVLAHTARMNPAVYRNSIFPEHEALPIPCTERATYPNALMAAGSMCHAYSQWLRDYPLVPRTIVDLNAGFMAQQ